MKLNQIAYNPVITKDAATLAIFLLAWKAFGMSPLQSAAVAGTFMGGTSPFVRQLVRPTAKDDDPVSTPVLDQVVREVIAQAGQAEVPPVAHPNNTVNTGWSPKVDVKPEGPDPTRTT